MNTLPRGMLFLFLFLQVSFLVAEFGYHLDYSHSNNNRSPYTFHRPEGQCFFFIFFVLCSCSGVANKTRNLIESSKRDINRLDLQKEVLESLFHVPERFEEAPRRTIPVRNVRPRASRKLVVEPLGDSAKDDTVSVKPQEVARDGIVFYF